MKITRQWAMPNKNTFQIKPIGQLIQKYKHGITIDPYANDNTYADITNDLDPQYNTNYNLDAMDFLKKFDTGSIDTVLFDPPYSPRQVSEHYKELGHTVNQTTTSSKYWSQQKQEISRITHKNSTVISCSWNSGGIGKKYGFEIDEILLVAHGGWHNDTIVVIEHKI